MAILSIQSHVVYGTVGNKAAVYPLQNLGYEVWPINTVQFSNHTGYGQWHGEIFSSHHIRDLIQGLKSLGVLSKTQAVLSGYMGSEAICREIAATVADLKQHQPAAIYLCDPVIGNQHCFVKPEVLAFFQTHLQADIITPNQFEAEILSGIAIQSADDLLRVADFFHQRQIQTVVITGISLDDDKEQDCLYVFLSKDQQAWLVETKLHANGMQINGAGDLFSALFLGYYLQGPDALQALKQTIYATDQVISYTLSHHSRELIINCHNYQNNPESDYNTILL